MIQRALEQLSYGAHSGTRTQDLMIKSHLLLPAKLKAHTLLAGNPRFELEMTESNSGVIPFHQFPILKNLATRRGLEPLTSSVTGWRTNQLYYRALFYIKPNNCVVLPGLIIVCSLSELVFVYVESNT